MPPAFFLRRLDMYKVQVLGDHTWITCSRTKNEVCAKLIAINLRPMAWIMEFIPVNRQWFIVRVINEKGTEVYRTSTAIEDFDTTDGKINWRKYGF